MCNVFLSPKQKFNCDIYLSMIDRRYLRRHLSKRINFNEQYRVMYWRFSKRWKNINSLEILIGKLTDRSAHDFDP